MIDIGAQHLTIDRLMSIVQRRSQIQLTQEAQSAIAQSNQYLREKLSEHETAYYGINTGFGSLCNVKIEQDKLAQLQYNLIVSHCCGAGAEIDDDIVRLMMLLKIQNLSLGHSGVRLELVARLVDLYNADFLPIIYEQGSLGASGDLAPLAHMSLAIIGEGEVKLAGQRMNTQAGLSQLKLSPFVLGPKEGLALINGTQFSTAFAVYCIYHAQKLARVANLGLALSLEGFDCDLNPFDHKLHEIRSHQGQIDVAKYICDVLSESQISGHNNIYVQDPYSFRCAPQVHGASMDTFNYISQVVTREINGVSDNPLLFSETDQILSGGNFHAQPIALALDFMAIALAELASISERRIYKLLSGTRGLKPYLAGDPGLESGLMITQYTAASIVSQNKQLCTPASVDSIVSSGGQEDHVSMAANAATKCYKVVSNIYSVLSIEFITAIQAIESRRPKQSSPYIEKLISEFRKSIPSIQHDQVLSTEIASSRKFIREIDI